jgi:hypothetical protein
MFYYYTKGTNIQVYVDYLVVHVTWDFHLLKYSYRKYCERSKEIFTIHFL